MVGSFRPDQRQRLSSLLFFLKKILLGGMRIQCRLLDLDVDEPNLYTQKPTTQAVFRNYKIGGKPTT
jgi:hypothetical protein